MKFLLGFFGLFGYKHRRQENGAEDLTIEVFKTKSSKDSAQRKSKKENNNLDKTRKNKHVLSSNRSQRRLKASYSSEELVSDLPLEKLTPQVSQELSIVEGVLGAAIGSTIAASESVVNADEFATVYPFDETNRDDGDWHVVTSAARHFQRPRTPILEEPSKHWTEKAMLSFAFVDSGVRSRAGQFLHSLIMGYVKNNLFFLAGSVEPRRISKSDIITFARAHPEALVETSINGFSHLNDLLNFTDVVGSVVPSLPVSAGFSPQASPVSLACHLKKVRSSELVEIMDALVDPLNPEQRLKVLSGSGTTGSSPDLILSSLPTSSLRRNWYTQVKNKSDSSELKK